MPASGVLRRSAIGARLLGAASVRDSSGPRPARWPFLVPRVARHAAALAVLLGIVFSTTRVLAQPAPWLARDSHGQLNEKILTQANVTAGTFAKLFTLPTSFNADSQAYAQVLIAPAVQINNAFAANLAIVATLHNNIYAFDANSGVTYWFQNYGLATSTGSSNNFTTSSGIVSTPAISGNNLFFVTRSLISGNVTYQLHIVDLRTGFELATPRTITASVNGGVTFNPTNANQRAALIVYLGHVYVAFGSQGDRTPYHGWVFTYTADTSLTQTGVFCTTPNGSQGGIWQAGGPPAVDGFAQAVYFVTGNGTSDSIGDFGDSVLRFTNASLTAFTAFRAPATGIGDDDFNANAPSVTNIGGRITQLIQGRKSGQLYNFNANTLQTLQSAFVAVGDVNNSSHAPLYNAGAIADPYYYLWAGHDFVKAYSIDPNSRLLGTSPALTGTVLSPTVGENGGALFISANGNVAGTRILWATVASPGGSNPDTHTVAGTLYAFNADNLTTLWSSDTNPNDKLGNLAKWNPVTVSDGRVFAPTFSGQVPVYGQPPTFWGQDYGFPQWSPIQSPLPPDWDPGSYKGECEFLGSNRVGQMVTGMSSFVAGNHQFHKILCSGANLDIVVPAQGGTACTTHAFDSGGVTFDWDVNYLKAQCPNNMYVKGVSQTTSGQANNVLCCPVFGAPLTISQNCTTEVFYGSDSAHYSGPEWDGGYTKGECLAGYVVAGVSMIRIADQGVPGAPHALLCCIP